MLLSNCDIHEIVTERASNYLNTQKPTFNQLKPLLINNCPIEPIHNEIIAILKQAKLENQARIKNSLEHQAYERQVAEDIMLAKNDSQQQTQDAITKATIHRELAHIPTLLTTYEIEIKVLNNRLAQNPGSERIKTAIEERCHAIELYKASRFSYQAQLQEIEQRAQLRHKRQDLLSKRQVARTDYSEDHEHIMDSLCEQTQIELTKNIQDQLLALDIQYDTLINDAFTVNYGIFFELVCERIQTNTYPLSEPDQQALQALTKMLQLHFDYEHKVSSITLKLQQKKQGIHALEAKLLELRNKLQQKNAAIELLSTQNDRFDLDNQYLSYSLEKHQKLNKNLAKPVFLLTVLMLLSCIPLLLFLTGIIPVFLAPFLVFSLLAIPAMLFFVGTITSGILSLIYGSKVQIGDDMIKLNSQSMVANAMHIKELTLASTLLETQIASQEDKISKESIAKTQLEQELEFNRTYAAQALSQAHEIVPVSVSAVSMGLFSPKPKHEPQTQAVSPLPTPKTDSEFSFDFTPHITPNSPTPSSSSCYEDAVESFSLN